MCPSKVVKISDENGEKVGWAQGMFSGNEPFIALSIQGHNVDIHYDELQKLMPWLVKHATPSKL